MKKKRTTFEGEKHFCGSVWVLSKGKPTKMLLVHHKKLGKWLQPGGHIEPTENPVETAVRELKEETGIDISFLLDEIDVIDAEGSFLPVPTFIMEQTIPAHGQDPAHFHIDMQYVVRVDEQTPSHRAEESHAIGWFTKKKALALPIHEDTRVVIHRLMK